MDCRHFRQHHLAYLDDTLPADLLVAAECHVIECEPCARHDTMVRRSLLLARNLPALEPSADFAARLETRLRAELAAGRRLASAGAALDAWDRPAATAGLRNRRAVAMAASLLLMASAAAMATWDAEPEVVTLPPVLATRPEPEPMPRMVSAPPASTLPAGDYVAPASTGVPVWPAAILAGELPVEMLRASSGVELVSYVR